MGGSQLVDKLLNGRRDGFFVECGAFRGDEYSDTLFFELERNWTGILIEAHPDYHRAILTKNRRALVLRACLSASRRPEYVRFRMSGLGSGVSALNKNWNVTDKQVRVAMSLSLALRSWFSRNFPQDLHLTRICLSFSYFTRKFLVSLKELRRIVKIFLRFS